MKRIEAMIRASMFEKVRDALQHRGIEGLTAQGPTTVETYLDLHRQTGARFSWGLVSGGSQVTGWTLSDAAHNVYKAHVGSVDSRQLYVNGELETRASSAKNPSGFTKTSTGYTFTDTSLDAYKNVSSATQSTFHSTSKRSWLRRSALESRDGGGSISSLVPVPTISLSDLALRPPIVFYSLSEIEFSNERNAFSRWTLKTMITSNNMIKVIGSKRTSDSLFAVMAKRWTCCVGLVYKDAIPPINNVTVRAIVKLYFQAESVSIHASWLFQDVAKVLKSSFFSGVLSRPACTT